MLTISPFFFFFPSLLSTVLEMEARVLGVVRHMFQELRLSPIGNSFEISTYQFQSPRRLSLYNSLPFCFSLKWGYSLGGKAMGSWLPSWEVILFLCLQQPIAACDKFYFSREFLKKATFKTFTLKSFCVSHLILQTRVLVQLGMNV